jgi:hypothetical protein
MRDLFPLYKNWKPLTKECILDSVSRHTPGCYVLAKTQGNIITSIRSGRSGDLYSRLNKHRRDGKYNLYRVEVVESGKYEDKALYLRECKLYHDAALVIGLGRGEKVHPNHPKGVTIPCPICGK